MATETETALVPSPVMEALSVARAPELVLEEARRAAQALKSVIDAKPRQVKFNNKQYLEFEDWLTVARFYGATVGIREVRYVEFGDVKGFEAFAQVILVSTGEVISSADAMCLNDEGNWKKKPLFQLRSMAQTRACARALRQVFAWVVVLAGYAGTPAEEMIGHVNGSAQHGPTKIFTGVVTDIKPNKDTGITAMKLAVDNDKAYVMAIHDHGIDSQLAKSKGEKIEIEAEQAFGTSGKAYWKVIKVLKIRNYDFTSQELTGQLKASVEVVGRHIPDDIDDDPGMLKPLDAEEIKGIPVEFRR